MKSIYAINHLKYFDRIVFSKRLTIANIINNYLKDKKVSTALDIGTTEDTQNISSNVIIKNLKNIQIFNSISDQRIISNFFNKILQKSITENFTDKEINEMISDVSLSNATIEHVGSRENQIKMIENMLKLSKQIVIFQTPYRYHPLDFHTKLPFIHWLPKKIHRSILRVFGLYYFAKEENLNLLSVNDIKNILNNFKSEIKFKIYSINFLGFKSNLIIFIEKNNIT